MEVAVVNIKLNYEHFCAADQGCQTSLVECNNIDKEQETRKAHTRNKVSIDGFQQVSIQVAEHLEDQGQ